jgi:hypothetical protein
VPVEVSKVEAASLAQRYLGGPHSKKEPPALHKLFMTMWTERCVKTSIPRSMHKSVVVEQLSDLETVLHFQSLYHYLTIGD